MEQRKLPFLDYFFKIYAVWCPKIAVKAKQAKIIWNETQSMRIAKDFWHAQSSFFLNKSDTSWKYPTKIFVCMSIFHRKNIYRSIIIEVNLEVLRSRHIKTTKFRSCCCFCVRHEKRTDKLSVRQKSIYCVKNARNALLRKHWITFHDPECLQKGTIMSLAQYKCKVIRALVCWYLGPNIISIPNCKNYHCSQFSVEISYITSLDKLCFSLANLNRRLKVSYCDPSSSVVRKLFLLTTSPSEPVVQFLN